MRRYVREINDPAQLEALAGDWEKLHQQTPGATFFQTLDWLRITLRHFKREQKLRLLLVCEGDELVGIVPFTVRSERFRLGYLRVLSFPLDDWGTFYGPIGKDPVSIFREAMYYIRHQPRDWDVIDFRYLCEQSEFFPDQADLLQQQSIKFYRRPRMEVPVVQMASSWEAYTKEKSKNWRRSMKREKERAAQHGSLRYVRYRTDVTEDKIDPRWVLFQQSHDVAEKSWQADSDIGASFCSPRVRPILRELHEAAAEKGMVDMNLLYLNDQPVAFLYNYYCRGNVYCLRSGYDASCEAKSLGTILLAEVIEDSHYRGDRQVNFGPGTQDYKLRFANSIQRAITFTHFSPWGVHTQVLAARAACDPLLPGFGERCQKRLVT
ncbi:GNAT family N-acetyltransferase [Bremerella sp. T1]|uniref:GNAT family N-acetyltransferase n=1 Tax=Bremerella sp. TYQ1 TaxID=3119568 RepID=UPI001CCC88D2|nr:GNAT family N-acetyltransferase [Bremerella volcania]UBM38528.1 GNAT family N-acetyltransferase [Bremerella volcania]